MSEKQKEELEQIGLIVFQKWHLAVILIGVIFTIGASWATSQSRVTDLENKVNSYRVISDDMTLQMSELRDSMEEMKFNLKRFMQEYKIQYIER